MDINSVVKTELLAASFSGLGTTAPNPCVAAALTIGNKLVAVEHTRPGGGLHAERALLKKWAPKLSASEIKKSRLWVTLEPCCHYGKNPPCTDIILEAKIPQVHYVFRDPNPQVAGRGLKLLRKQNVKLTHEKKWQPDLYPLLGGFLQSVQKRRPTLWFKSATTVDGFVADAFGTSKWITGPGARAVGHRLRLKCDAILTGAGTFFADKPNLLARETGKLGSKGPIEVWTAEDWHHLLLDNWNPPKKAGPSQPQRLVVFEELRRPLRKSDLKPLEPISTPVFFFLLGHESNQSKKDWWLKSVPAKFSNNFILFDGKHSRRNDLFTATSDARHTGGLYAIAIPGKTKIQRKYELVLEAAYILGNHRLLLEGGPRTLNRFLPLAQAGDELFHFQAPVVLGGQGMFMFAGDGPRRLEDKIKIAPILQSRIGPDILTGYRFK